VLQDEVREGKKERQGSTLDPLGPEAPDPISAARLFLASWRST
jgi:hypothetical protein